jgi:uncharacterized protein
MDNRSVITFHRLRQISKPALAILCHLVRLTAMGFAFTHPALCLDQAALDRQLYQAIAKGDVGAVRVLLDNGADIEARNERGETPLFTAVANHNAQMVKLLLEKGAQVSARDNYRETPLTEAASSMESDMLPILLAAKPDSEQQDAALLEAVKSGPVVIREADAPAAQNDHAPQPMAEFPWVTNVRLLLDAGADIETRDEEGSTPLMRAATYAQTETFKLLLERGAKINVRDKGGRTLLIAAACDCAIATMDSTYEIMKLLLEKGVNVNARDHDGQTALMLAAGSPDGSPSVKLLLDHGANPMARDNSGRTALDYTKDSPFPEKAEQMKKAMAKNR